MADEPENQTTNQRLPGTRCDLPVAFHPTSHQLVCTRACTVSAGRASKVSSYLLGQDHAKTNQEAPPNLRQGLHLCHWLEEERNREELFPSTSMVAGSSGSLRRKERPQPGCPIDSTNKHVAIWERDPSVD